MDEIANIKNKTLIDELNKYIVQIKNDITNSSSKSEELKHSHRLNSVRSLFGLEALKERSDPYRTSQ